MACFIKKNWFPLRFPDGVKGIIKRIETDRTKAITPPNLLGIDRRMA
jgi:hypothetical protein